MKLEMLAILREQAERLLMVTPGQFEFSPIEFCKQQVLQTYIRESRAPRKDSKEEKIMIAKLTWLGACEWWSVLGPKDNPDPADCGIFSVSGTDRHKTMKVYCYDYNHYRSLPEVVVYQGSRFGRSFWEAKVYRATYRNDTLLALGTR